MKVVLLDFNGTLFFDSGFHQEAWAEIYRELNPNKDDGPDGSFYCGPRNDVLIQMIAPWLSEQERQEVSRRKEALYRKICKENPHRVQLVDGAIEFLDELKERNVPFILASASIKDNIDFYFETFDLGRWFDKELCVYDDGTYKDKGEMHKEAARRLGVELPDCVVVEDSVSAITHAKENGAGCIVAIGNESAKEEIMNIGVNHYIKDFTEIKCEWFE
ncbi:MAG: HAD family phosphatase [Lachnospiraceae bacterium]|nr:HAD family phosphatase [Lachnospiraceae bacterium]